MLCLREKKYIHFPSRELKYIRPERRLVTLLTELPQLLEENKFRNFA